MKLKSLLITTILLIPIFSFAQFEEGFKLEPDPQALDLNDGEGVLGNEEANPFLGIWCEPMSGNMDFATRYIFKNNSELLLFGMFDKVTDASVGVYELKPHGDLLTYQITATQTKNEALRIWDNPDTRVARMTDDGRIRIFSASLIEKELFESNGFTDFSDILSDSYNPDNDLFLTPCEKVKGFESEL